MYIIAKDGTGDFTSVQAAVDTVPISPRHPVILLLRNGEYREKIIVNKDNVRIIGESRDGTVITWDDATGTIGKDGEPMGTFGSYTVLVTGNNVEFENITIRNTASEITRAGQAVAVYAAGDRGVWRNVCMTGHQDTLLCGPVLHKVAKDALPRYIPSGVASVGDCPQVMGRQYFEDCYIQGDVDFVFGPYTCWFERCRLHMNKRGGCYTAANTPEQVPYGMIFHKCRLTGDCDPGRAALGRPWRKFAHTMFIECEMDECVDPYGFHDWGETKITRRCGEYRTTGARADQSTRHPLQARLSDEEAAMLTVSNVIGGYDGWNPVKRTPTWFLCGDSTMASYDPRFAPMTGWWQVLGGVVKDVFIENCAVCGRSDKSFVEENRLELIKLCLRKGDKLLVQFGHNDEKDDPARSTTAWGTYQEYLERFIDAAHSLGAEPVLLTPIARRAFDESGNLIHTHKDYPAAMHALVEKHRIRLLDMESATKDLISNMGEEGAKALFNWQKKGHPNYPDGAEDNTHLSFDGAVKLARLASALMENC